MRRPPLRRAPGSFFQNILDFLETVFPRYPGYFVGRDLRIIRDILEDQSRLSMKPRVLCRNNLLANRVWLARR